MLVIEYASKGKQTARTQTQKGNIEKGPKGKKWKIGKGGGAAAGKLRRVEV